MKIKNQMQKKNNLTWYERHLSYNYENTLAALEGNHQKKLKFLT